MKLKLGLLTIMFIVLTIGICQQARAENLLPNWDFEDYCASNHSRTWVIDCWQNYSKIGITDQKAHCGKYSVFIRSEKENDARIIQSVAVEPDTAYRFSGWVATDCVDPKKIGASLCVMGGQFRSADLRGSRDWQRVELVFRTRPTQTTATLGVRLGHYFNTTVGLAYFDDLKLERLSVAPVSCQVLDEDSAGFTISATQQPQITKANPKLSFTHKLLYQLLGLVSYQFATLLFFGVWLVMLFLRTEKVTLNVLHLENHRRFEAKLPWLFGITAVVAIILRIPLFPEAPLSGDTALFVEWSKRIVETGPASFYTPDYFCDYPPFALYILWGFGWVGKAWRLTDNFAYFACLLKVPGIFCDLGTAWLIVLFFKQKNPVLGWLLSTVYLFWPSVIINSAYWGQVDCYYAFLVLSAFYCLTVKQQPEIAAGLAMASLLTKTQTVAFLPLLFLYLFFNFKWKRILLTLGAASVTFLAIVAPFNVLHRMSWFVDFYTKQAGNYPYASVNAANLMGVLKGNYVSDALQILPGISYNKLGMGLFALCVIWSGVFYWRKKTKGSLMAAVTVVAFAFYVFCPRMHERYLFPALVFSLLTVGYYKDKKLHFLAIVLSCGYLLNMYGVLLNYQGKIDKASFDQWLLVLSWVNTVSFVLFWFRLQMRLFKKNGVVRRSLGRFAKKRPKSLSPAI